MEPKPPAHLIRGHYRHRRYRARGIGTFTREYEERIAADLKRYEQEKRVYNDGLNLEDDILTDQEAMDECECGNGADSIQAETERLQCEQNWARYRLDHPKFNQLHQPSEPGVDSRRFHRFKDLPMEIKNQICRYVLCGPQTGREIRQWQLHYEAKHIPFELRFTHLQPLDTRILVASRELYNSALHELSHAPVQGGTRLAWHYTSNFYTPNLKLYRSSNALFSS